MKKIIILCLTIALLISGCTAQTRTKKYGGNMTITLPENTKLEMITWKDASLWYTTRPMREDETAETHTFQESSNFGILEGTITIIETKGEN